LFQSPFGPCPDGPDALSVIRGIPMAYVTSRVIPAIFAVTITSVLFSAAL
jgi:hypothetical protein